MFTTPDTTCACTFVIFGAQLHQRGFLLADGPGKVWVHRGAGRLQRSGWAAHHVHDGGDGADRGSSSHPPAGHRS